MPSKDPVLYKPVALRRSERIKSGTSHTRRFFRTGPMQFILGLGPVTLTSANLVVTCSMLLSSGTKLTRRSSSCAAFARAVGSSDAMKTWHIEKLNYSLGKRNGEKKERIGRRSRRAQAEKEGKTSDVAREKGKERGGMKLKRTKQLATAGSRHDTPLSHHTSKP
jgi:hypothetical protein